jgi:N-acetylglucosaminyl-diphospho-decaprenol L-rhamnosyltransferase
MIGAGMLDGIRAVVLAYGAGNEYLPLVESLVSEGLGRDHILVVHNPSEPGERLPVTADGCEILKASHNLGYAAGMNLGIERQLRHDGDLVLILTHDARLRPGTLRKLADMAHRIPKYGVLGPELVLGGTDTPFSFGGITRGNGTRGHIRERPRVDGEVAPCDWIDGGTMLIRTEVLEQIGGFDERFWIYCEDSDLCLRAHRAGYRVGVLLDARAEQSPGGEKRRAAWAYLMARNGAAYAARAGGIRGLGLTVGRTAAEASLDFARAAARCLRLRKGPPMEPWSMAVGAARGLLDFIRGRWGPPPRLPGGGDIQNVGDRWKGERFRRRRAL